MSPSHLFTIIIIFKKARGGVLEGERDRERFPSRLHAQATAEPKAGPVLPLSPGPEPELGVARLTAFATQAPCHVIRSRHHKNEGEYTQLTRGTTLPSTQIKNPCVTLTSQN